MLDAKTVLGHSIDMQRARLTTPDEARGLVECFCGSVTHETARCRHCAALIIRHDEPGLIGWFARPLGFVTFADGDCYANALDGMHSPDAIGITRDDRAPVA